MSMTLTVIDIETPNGKNDSICQFGIKHIENGSETFNECMLINPEADFNNVNIRIHGISPDMVVNSPTMFEYWQKISTFFENSIVVGHNIKFDLCVLTKALKKYNIILPELPIICTRSLAERYLPLDKNSLSNVCDYLCIPLGNSHNAGEDVKMCYGVFVELLKTIPDIKSEVEMYKFCGNINSPSRRDVNSNFTDNTKSIIELKQVVESIMEDGIIENREVWELEQWLSSHEELFGYYPYDKISSTIYSVLEDGIITQEEYVTLEQIFSDFLNPLSSDIIESGSIDLKGKTFCLTGDFNHGDRFYIEQLLISKGGIRKSGVSAKLDYLIVGDKGSQAWKFGNYGGKIQKAMELKEKGNTLQILVEKELFDSIY